MYPRIAFFLVALSIAATAIGLLITSLLGITIATHEHYAKGRWVIGGILFIGWFLFFWLVKFMQLLLDKQKNTIACIVAISPAIYLCWFLFACVDAFADL
jgi:hypothetical protein